MNEEKILQLYGLKPDDIHRLPIRELLQQEIENQEATDHEYLRTLCIMLFCIGIVEDTRLIWQAKRKNGSATLF